MTTVTTCHQCGEPYDPLEASWCDCPVDEPTFVCPSCAGCFCEATSAYRDGFWQVAPEELWQRRAERAITASGAPPALEPGREAPLVLLLCRESRAMLEAKRALSGLGCSFAFAGNRDECLEKARRYAPALVIADDRIEGLDDDRFARALRSAGPPAGPKVAILSSLYRTPAQKREARARLEIDAVLGRPLSADDARGLLHDE